MKNREREAWKIGRKRGKLKDEQMKNREREDRKGWKRGRDGYDSEMRRPIILGRYLINGELMTKKNEVVLEDETTIFSKKEYARCVQQIK